jgi:hypothetical protein
MKKLRMSLDDLAIESFATDGVDADTGTVLGHDATETHCTANGGTELTHCWGQCGDGTTTGGGTLFTNLDDTCYYTAGPWDTCMDCGPTFGCID